MKKSKKNGCCWLQEQNLLRILWRKCRRLEGIRLGRCRKGKNEYTKDKKAMVPVQEE